MRLDILHEDLVEGIEDDEALDGGEEVVAAAGDEVDGDDGVRLRGIDGLALHREPDEALADLVGRVVLDLDALAHLQEGRDLVPVGLVHAAHDALEDGAELGARERDLHHGVAEGERRQHLAAGHGALVDGRADPARVDEGEGRRAVVVEAVLEDGAGLVLVGGR